VLTEQELQTLRGKIKAVLDENGGKIVAEARASSSAQPSFTLRPPHDER
jgi:hypothetical protein